jgi:hypothetical protein
MKERRAEPFTLLLRQKHRGNAATRDDGLPEKK